MDAAQLIAEGERLARPCIELRTHGEHGSLAGVWGGNDVLQPHQMPWKHWLTIDCTWLARIGLPLRGLLGVFTNVEDDSTGKVVQTAHGALPRGAHGGIALYGREARSFPPIEATFQFGSPAVAEWLDSLEWPRDAGGGANFPDPAGQAYDREYCKRCQLYDRSNEIAAVLGGWHLPWPDGDWAQLNDKRLVVWTFRDAEPWVEVWLDPAGSFEVVQRVT